MANQTEFGAIPLIQQNDGSIAHKLKVVRFQFRELLTVCLDCITGLTGTSITGNLFTGVLGTPGRCESGRLFGKILKTLIIFFLIFNRVNQVLIRGLSITFLARNRYDWGNPDGRGNPANWGNPGEFLSNSIFRIWPTSLYIFRYFNYGNYNKNNQNLYDQNVYDHRNNNYCTNNSK